MRQPNTFYTRKFIDVAKTANGSGQKVIDNEVIRGVRDELLEHMLYVTELERLLHLAKQSATNQNITVEIRSEDF